MANLIFLIVAATMGVIVLGSVTWNYVLSTAQQKITLSIILSVIGAILVSSPLWSSIVIKSPEWELKLLKEHSVKQIEDYISLLEAYKQSLPPEKAEIISPESNKLRSSLKELKETQSTNELLEKYYEFSGNMEATRNAIAELKKMPTGT